MSTGLGDICLNNDFFMLQFTWFGSVDKIKAANQIKPCN